MQYLRLDGQVRAFFDTWRYNGWQTTEVAEVVRDRTLSLIAHICQQEFGPNMLQCIEPYMKDEAREETSEELQPFCFEWLDEETADDV